MTNEEYILDWFKNHVWTRPKPSKVCDGVGMFAIRDIPKGTSVYDLADRSATAWISWDTIKTLPQGIIDWFTAIQPHAGTRVCNPDFKWKSEYGPLWTYTIKGMNFQSTWYFSNHSDNANTDSYATDDPRVYRFITNRDVQKGEELFDNYDSKEILVNWLDVAKRDE